MANRHYRAKLTNIYKIVDGEKRIISQMYSYKAPRKKYLNEISLANLRKKVTGQVSKTNRKLSRLVRDVNKGVYNPKTKRFERKGTITVIDRDDKRRKVKTTNIKDYRGKFASKKLEELDSFNKKANKIELTGNESKEELMEINKLTENFLKSKTSTIKGIESVEKEIKNNLSAKLDEYDMTPSEIDSLYKLFEDKDFTALRKYLDPSEIQTLMLEVKEYKENLFDSDLNNEEIDNLGLSKFADLFVNYAGLDENSAGLDVDLQESLSSLYKKIDTIL